MKNQKKIFDIVSLKCSKNVTKAYSTSFTLAIKSLNKIHRPFIYSIYGYVRLADEIVDSFHDYNKQSLISQLRKETSDAINQRISLNPIINSFQNTVNKYNIEWELIDSFLNSMEYDINHKKCNTNEYKKYIAGSAEAVGLMCLRVFVNGNEQEYLKLKPYAVSLGSAFQKINFLRDLKEDHKILDRQYFPDFKINKFDNEKKKIIEKDIELDFQKSLDGIKMLKKDSRRGVYLAYIYYTSLFNKIKKLDSSQILKKRIRISNSKKILLLISLILGIK